MWHVAMDVAHSVVCVSVCLCQVHVSHHMMAEPIEMSFGMQAMI